MTDIEARLAAALEINRPAPRDPMFRVALMIRREQFAARQRLLRASFRIVAAAILSALAVVLAAELGGGSTVQLATAAIVGVALILSLSLPWSAAGLRSGALARVPAMLRPGLWY